MTAAKMEFTVSSVQLSFAALAMGFTAVGKFSFHLSIP
jgi:hypothetical protein